MQVLILAGGLGTRFGNITEDIPKPMIRIGKYPMLIHIMDIYAKYGHREFFVALGYKGQKIKEYFKNFRENSEKSYLVSKSNKYEKYFLPSRNWSVQLIDTGKKTMTGGRVKIAIRYLSKETFFLTYGDGIADINLDKLLKCHKKNKRILTMTAVHPPARFGELEISKNVVKSFEEKPQLQKGWINGGFFVVEPVFAKYIEKNTTILEREPMKNLVLEKKLTAYKHESFWHCVDTKRDLDKIIGIYNIKKNKFDYQKI